MWITHNIPPLFMCVLSQNLFYCACMLLNLEVYWCCHGNPWLYIRGTPWNTFQLFSGGHIHTGFTDVAGCVVVSPGELGVVLISVSVFTIYLSSHRCVKFIRPFIWITMVVGNCGYHGNISGLNSCFPSHDMILRYGPLARILLSCCVIATVVTPAGQNH